jgi:hypothetical protein
MSKGLGHVGRAIAAAFDAEPDNAFTTSDLCLSVYPYACLERSERVAVLRAVKSLAVHRPDLALDSYETESTRGSESVFYRRDRVLSYAMARLKAAQRRNWDKTDDELRAKLAPGGDHRHLIEPGGHWLRHTEMAIARRDGDHAALARLEAEQERALGFLAERVKAASEVEAKL